MWRLTGPSNFIDQVVDELHGGTSAVVRVPPYFPNDFLLALKAELDRRGRVRCVRLPGDELRMESEAQITTCLFELEGIESSDPTDLASFVSSTRDTVFTCHLSDHSSWQTWWKWLNKLRLQVQQLPEYDRTSFCVTVPNSVDPIKYEVGLRPFDLESGLRELDVSHFVDDQPALAGEKRLERRVRLATIVELARFDLNLAEDLSKETLDTLIEPSKLLRKFRAQSSWMNDNCSCWVNGAKSVWYDRLESHSCYLEAHDQRQEIQRRIWKAQLTTLFPHLEQRRLEIINCAKPILPKRFESATGEVKDPELLELGELNYLMSICQAPKRLRDEVRSLAEVRNELAHLRPICMRLFDRI